MLYARAYNQTVADDFYTAMERVEQRLEIAAEEEGDNKDVMGDVKVQDYLDQLVQPGLGETERLAIVARLRKMVVPKPVLE